MKKIFYLFFAALAITSCSDQENNLEREQGIANGITKGMSTLRMDFTKPVVYNFSGEEEQDVILKKISEEIFEVELFESVDKEGRKMMDEFTVNISINRDLGIITVNPGPITPAIITYGDNEDCGGKAGDGWKSYGTCMSAKCVEDKSKTAAADLKASDLKSGQCFDLRVKRNTLNARVCARIISC